MIVQYTPALMDQIRHARADAARPIVVRVHGHLVERVDPRTRQCTGEPQQFRRATDGALTILPKSAWVTEPTIVDVDRLMYG